MAEPNAQEPQGDAPQPDSTLGAPPVVVPEPVPPADAVPPASLARLDLILLALLLILAFLLGSFAAANSDVWLQLASGKRIAHGEWAVGVDPFSFATEAGPTHPAVRWVEHSWLYALVFYALHNLVGGAGLVVLKAILVAALAWCLVRIPGDKRSRLISVIYVGLTLLALSPQLLLRPMTVSFLLFGITLLFCYRAGALGDVVARPRLLWWLVPLFCLWANLDAWFILGPLTLALLWAGMGLGRLLGIRATFPGRVLGGVLGIGILACMLNPNHVARLHATAGASRHPAASRRHSGFYRRRRQSVAACRPRFLCAGLSPFTKVLGQPAAGRRSKYRRARVFMPVGSGVDLIYHQLGRHQEAGRAGPPSRSFRVVDRPGFFKPCCKFASSPGSPSPRRPSPCSICAIGGFGSKTFRSRVGGPHCWAGCWCY